MQIRSRYSERVPVCLETGSESFVQQHFADSCDVKKIIARFTRTGVLDHVNQLQPQYGDFTSVPTFEEAQQIIAQTSEYFASLPGHVKDRFGNDVKEFLAFVNDEANIEEGRKLGIFAPEAKAEQPVQKVDTAGSSAVEENK